MLRSTRCCADDPRPELLADHDLVDAPQLREREARREEVERRVARRVVEVAAEAPVGAAQDLARGRRRGARCAGARCGVVRLARLLRGRRAARRRRRHRARRRDVAEVERAERDPLGLDGVVAGVDRRLGRAVRDERDGDGVPARVAARVAERAELLELRRAHGEARLLVELARRGAVERLVLVHEPAGQRPAALERLVLPADEQDGEVVRAQRERDDVRRYAWAWVGIGEGHAARVMSCPRGAVNPPATRHLRAPRKRRGIDAVEPVR